MRFLSKVHKSYEVVSELPSPSQEIIGLLQDALMAEYQQWDLYVAYRDRLRGLARGPIADEFKDHAGEEQEHIEVLQRYLVGYGLVPTTRRLPIEELGLSPKMQDFIRLELKYEREAVEIYSLMVSLLKDGDPLKVDLENILSKEQEHVHELELLLKNP